MHDVLYQHKAALTAKIASKKIGIIVDELPDVTREQNVNGLFTYCDADRNAKAVTLFDTACMKAASSVPIDFLSQSVLSATLDDYGKCSNDITALFHDSAEGCTGMRYTVREIREAENANFVQVKDLPHFLRVAVSKALLCNSVDDIREAVIEFGVLFKHADFSGGNIKYVHQVGCPAMKS